MSHKDILFLNSQFIIVNLATARKGLCSVEGKHWFYRYSTERVTGPRLELTLHWTTKHSTVETVMIPPPASDYFQFILALSFNGPVFHFRSILWH